jgi:hypothetical protein
MAGGMLATSACRNWGRRQGRRLVTAPFGRPHAGFGNGGRGVPGLVEAAGGVPALVEAAGGLF